MPQTRPVASPRPFTGRHMLAITVAFFGVIFAVNILMAVISMQTWTGLVVDNSYVASQQYQEKLEAHRVQAEAGWVSTLGYEGGRIRLDLVAENVPVAIGGLRIRLNRPIGTREDRVLELVAQPDGGYAADVELPDGMWEALVTAAETPLGPYELHKRFKVEPGT